MIAVSHSTESPTDDEIGAFQTATRDLIGVALRSLDILEGEVSLPQFRLMLTLRDLGCVPSVRLAEALGLGGSSVTRLADRLVASGHVQRGTDRANRSVVTLALTEHGDEIVDRVLTWRHHELSRILGELTADSRAATAAGLARLHEVVGNSYADLHGPVPL